VKQLTEFTTHPRGVHLMPIYLIWSGPLAVTKLNPSGTRTPHRNDNGKTGESRRRKATGLPPLLGRIAGLPNAPTACTEGLFGGSVASSYSVHPFTTSAETLTRTLSATVEFLRSLRSQI
jgi:hypothetical protein